MQSPSLIDVELAWAELDRAYDSTRLAVNSFAAEAALVGTQLIQDVPTRLEYMKLIRAEADDVLAWARCNRGMAARAFDYIAGRRNELRLIQQDKARATVAVLSKLLTRQPAKHQLLVNAANALAREGKLPSVGAGKDLKAVPLKDLSPEQMDEVFLKAIDKAGGSRKSITPGGMKLRGAGLLLLSVALAGLDIYVSRDKSFAVSKNATSMAGGFGGAWAGAAAGLLVAGPLGGLVGLIVGGAAGGFAAEEIHYSVRGLHADPRVDQLVDRYYGMFSFDEEGLARAMHVELLGDLGLVYIAFSNLDEKRHSDADDVAFEYVRLARLQCRSRPKGALADGLGSPSGAALVDLLKDILAGGWTSIEEQAEVDWLQSLRR
ncbi:MAG: hypothetical protein JNL87_17130 [Burkholderiaceae bacterium]|nr:hypothetical protein [Burkholderiaceae bacterium]